MPPNGFLKDGGTRLGREGEGWKAQEFGDARGNRDGQGQGGRKVQEIGDEGGGLSPLPGSLSARRENVLLIVQL